MKILSKAEKTIVCLWENRILDEKINLKSLLICGIKGKLKTKVKEQKELK